MNFFSSTLKAVKSNIQYDITYGSQSTYDLDRKLYDLDLLTPNECSEYDNIMYCCRKKMLRKLYDRIHKMYIFASFNSEPSQ